MKKKEIILAWTRDFTLPWAEWWSRDMNPRLIEVFGTGIPNQLSYFNGRLLETYRPLDEAKGFIEAIVNTDLRNLGTDKIRRYVLLNKRIRELIKKTNKRKNFSDRAIFEKLKVLSREMYPWYAVSYLLPQDQWADKLIEKYPTKAGGILKLLLEARKQSEGTVEELIEYWRATAQVLLKQRKFSSKYVSFLTFREIEKMFDDINYIPKREQLEERSRGYIFFRNTVYTSVTKKTFFQKHGFIYHDPANNIDLKEIKGTVSCPGPSSIKGSVCVILTNDEIKNFKAGKILVTVMTNPFFISIMQKAKAIVTDEGGITCHAAIVSRELGIPCVIGTKIATKIFKDGDIVEVDANRGGVKIIK